MPNGQLESRRIATYAHTLFEAALTEDRVFENQNALGILSHASSEFRAVIATMLKEGDFDRLDDVSRLYNKLVASNRAAGEHVASGDAYDQDLNALSSKETIGVHVTTAVPLDDELREIIQNRCEADLRSKVFLIEHVDPTIIGGIVLSARGMHRDASVKAQLESARKVLTHESTTSNEETEV